MAATAAAYFDACCAPVSAAAMPPEQVLVQNPSHRSHESTCGLTQPRACMCARLIMQPIQHLDMCCTRRRWAFATRQARAAHAASRATPALADPPDTCNVLQVGAASAVFATRQAALRALRELHRAQLQVEVESEAQVCLSDTFVDVFAPCIYKKKYI